MKAMVFAAGLGTRLRPLTSDRPKALVEVSGHTMLEITLKRLRAFGIDEVIINTHHYADMIQDYLKARHSFGMSISISREDVLLDTGGGLKKAFPFFLQGGMDTPFLVHNVDVISNINLAQMVRFHREQEALATLAVQARHTSRPLLFDRQGRLSRRGNPDSPADQDMQALAFAGIHVISPRIIAAMPQKEPFSIIDTYVGLARREKICGFRADECYWRDLGRPENVEQAARDIAEGKYSIKP